MSLNQAEQEALLNVSSKGADAIDAFLAILRTGHPGAFHTEESLAERRFFDQPKHTLPHCGFVRACPPEQEGK